MLRSVIRALLRIFSTLATILIIYLIFQLTEMSPAQTTALSNETREIAHEYTSSYVIEMPALSAGNSAGESAGGVLAIFEPNVALAYSETPSEFKQSVKNASNLSPRQLLSKLKSKVAELVYGNVTVRQWAHVIEFGALGLSAAVMFLSWFATRGAGKGRIVFLYALTLAFCAANSLFDQLHKLYVPGREFDVRDLILDLGGYGVAVTAIFLVFGLCCAVFGEHGSSRPGYISGH